MRCIQCYSTFAISEREAAFYSKVGPVFSNTKYNQPDPELCPDCRRQRRLAFRNQSNLYLRKCDFSDRRVLSPYHSDKPFPVYHHEDWWANRRSSLEFGRPFDFSRPFFDQFLDLRNAVPVESARIVNCENCEYTNNARKCKNSYLIFGCFNCEDCLYIDGGASSKSCILGWQINKAELCYHIYRCDRVFCCFFCELCFCCSDLWFCKLCKDCTHCFCCSQLRHKQYCIFNKQHSKQEYQDFISSINTGSRAAIEYWRKKSQDFYLTIPEPPYKGFNNEDCIGDVIFNSRDCRQAFTITNSEKSKYIYECNQCVHAYDLDNTNITTGLCYQTVHSTTLFDTQFAVNCHNCADCQYVMDCIELKRCFGCIGLYNEEFCILNKHYSKQEYEQLVPQIIRHMEETDEWGYFFPPNLSRFGYNETPASGNYPIDQEEAERLGFQWSDYQDPARQFSDLIHITDLPDDIAKVPDSIVEHPIECAETGRPYKIQKKELKFYKMMKLPLPRTYPNKQFSTLYCLRNKMAMNERQCDRVEKGKRCTNIFLSPFPDDSQQKVYCFDCYHRCSYY
jgi:hypothetical protein